MAVTPVSSLTAVSPLLTTDKIVVSRDGTTLLSATLADVFASPALTAIPTAPTAAASDSSTQIATTAHVKSVITGRVITIDDVRDTTGWSGSPDSLKEALQFLRTGETTAVAITGGTIDGTSIGATTRSSGAFTTLDANGNVTLGDASADTLTINAGTWTIGNAVTSTRAIGVAPTGNTNSFSNVTTFSGDVGGATTLTAYVFNTTASGANSISSVRNVFPTLTVSTTAGTVATATNFTSLAINSNASAVTNLIGYESQLRITGSGNVGTGRAFLAGAPTLSSTGLFTTLVGYDAGNLGHATLVGTAIAFRAAEQTASVTLTVGFQSALVAGTNKWGFYASGTANNAFAGPTRFGSTSVPAAQVHLSAGTATAGTAPLVFTSGTNLTTAVAGTMEYNGTNLFFTRSGTTRETNWCGNSGAAAPGTSVFVAAGNYYGSSSTNILGTPNSWASVNIGGTDYKIPLYT